LALEGDREKRVVGSEVIFSAQVYDGEED
jgi:hypothetical protein